MPLKQHGTDHYTLDELIALIEEYGGGGMEPTDKGVTQTLNKNFDCFRAAGNYQFAWCYDQDIILESITCQATVNLSDDAVFSGFGISTVNGGDLISSNRLGVKANLGQYKQIAWRGTVRLNVGEYIICSIAGGSADASPSNIEIVVKYFAVEDGGYLA
jgi:hypothetical protein